MVSRSSRPSAHLQRGGLHGLDAV